MKKLRVAVLFGGRSGEHEVSCASAQSVIRALDSEKYDVEPVLIAKDGRWLVGEGVAQYLTDGTVLKNNIRESMLVPCPQQQETFDVVIPLIHGTNGEDGTLQGLLELAGVPYVGAGVLGSAVGMDKIMQKAVLRDTGIPVASSVSCTADQYNRDSNACHVKMHDLGYPLFVKPANGGSSVGISKVRDRSALEEAITSALRYDERVLAELAVPEARELEIAVLGNDTPRASVIGEIIPSGEFYDYQAKYVDDASELIIPAELADDVAERIHAFALQAFEVLNLSGMARVDFLISKTTGELVLNEVNTIPGFTEISMYPKLWEASELPYSKLIDELIHLARERFAARNALQHDIRPSTWWTQSA